MNKDFNRSRHGILAVLILLITSSMNSCTTSKGNQQVTSNISIIPTEVTIEMQSTGEVQTGRETPSQELVTTLNGLPFTLETSPRVVGDTLWLPAVEIFNLLERPDINSNEKFISTGDYNEKHTFFNCHFGIGEKTYSTDTANDIWIESKDAPYKDGEEVFLTEKMIEDCVGEIIQFDASKKTINLSIKGKQIGLLQDNNDNPIANLKLKKPENLIDTRINTGVGGCYRQPADDWIGWSQTLKADGFTRARITLYDYDPYFAPLEKDIPNEYIAVFQTLKDLGIDTRYSLNFWDLIYRKNGGTISRHRLSSEGEIERYLDYVTLVATRLEGLVGGYELWNEPDANEDIYQRMDPEVFIEVARRAIPLIRKIDPLAKIVVPSTSSYIDPAVQEYTKVILESDILPLVDVISLHTVNNDASPVYMSDYYYNYDEMWRDIKKIAEVHGFKGEYIADELNYRSFYSLEVLQPEPNDYNPSEPEVAAKYIGRMIAINLGMNISVGTSGTDSNERPIEGRMIRNMAYLLEGLQVAEFPVEVYAGETLVRQYTFEDQDGSRYLAVWNDGEAKVTSDDLEYSLFFRNYGAESVIVIDPLLSVMQVINFNNGTDGVHVESLILKDYPLIYKFNALP